MDAVTGAPLDGAEIVVPGAGAQALSASNGRFFIVNLMPGTHTMVARRAGFQSLEIRNVVVWIDRTRRLDVRLAPASVGLIDEAAVTADLVPLVDPGVSGSRTNIRAEEIEASPVMSLWDVFALQQGFMLVPPNTDVLAYVDTRRSPNAPVRVRGGRVGETSFLIDGFPVNDVVFGGPAFDLGLEAVQQIDYQRGGFDVQYGNAMSGIVNVATRDGGTRLEGTLSYQTSGVAGAFGSTADELAGFGLLQGRLSGPVPGTGSRLRFLVAGRNQVGADRVLEFDDVIIRPSVGTGDRPPYRSEWPRAEWGDLIPGWRSFGYDHVWDVTAKLTYYVTPAVKLSGLYTGAGRQRMPFDFDYLLTGYDYLSTPGAVNLEDSLVLEHANYYPGPSRIRSELTRGSIRARHDVLVGQVEHALAGSWSYRVLGGWHGQRRETCNFFQGLCLMDAFGGGEWTYPSDFVVGSDYFSYPAPVSTDNTYADGAVDSYVGRVDAGGRVVDYHNLRFGLQAQRHRLEVRNVHKWGYHPRVSTGVASGYAAQPWEVGLFLQDRMEWDFLTVTLGLRYDIGHAGGIFFANPVDPTNGTTVREICEADPVRFTVLDPTTGERFYGMDACERDPELMATGTREAQADDFANVGARGHLSPRIGVSVPFGERAQVFFNYGQFSARPRFNSLYQGTGIGTTAGGNGGGLCDQDAVVPGTSQCHPIVQADEWPTPYVGDPNLQYERTTAYELGIGAEISRDVAVRLIAFGKEQSGLTGLAQGGVTEAGDWAYDLGGTYTAWQYDSLIGSRYDYRVLANQEQAVVWGVELSLHRRLAGFWGASVDYTFTDARATAAAPDLEFQRQEWEGEWPSSQESRLEVDRPHVLNASLYLVAGNEAVLSHPVVDAFVRNGQLGLTMHAASGLPYTPILRIGEFGRIRTAPNGARGPSLLRFDAFAAKDFLLANLRVGLFLRVVNLLDTRSCEQVFPTTGDCESGTVDPNRFHGWPARPYEATSTFFDRPHYYAERRSINVGARLQF